MRASRFLIAVTGFLSLTVLTGIDTLMAQTTVTEGKWEVTTEMEMEGMSFKMPPTKTTQCITKENVVPKGPDDGSCKILSQSIKGNRVTWRMKCVEKDATTDGEGDITYSGTSYRGTLAATRTEKGGERQQMKMKLTGKRIGECGEADRKERETLQSRMDQTRPVQQEYEARLRRAKELAGITVPEEGRDSCLAADPGCEQRFGKLNLREGEWEIVEESTSRTGTQKEYYTPADLQKSTRCLAGGDAIAEATEQSCQNGRKRSGNRMTWKTRCAYPGSTVEEQGSISYNGDSYEGVKTKKMTSAQTDTTFFSKLSGRRTGDGTCLAARDYTTKRDYTAKRRAITEKPAEDLIEKPERPLDNPVKTLRKIFRF